MSFLAGLAWIILGYAAYHAFREGLEAWFETLGTNPPSSGADRAPVSLSAGARFPGAMAPADPRHRPGSECPGSSTVGEARRRPGT